MFFGKRFSGYHKKSLSGLEILVLSIITNNNGITGYELIQDINEKFKELWQASAGTIYPLLNRLSNKLLVEMTELVDESNRKKKVYRITEKGKEELKRVLEDNLEPSITTLGDYIKTIIKASVPSEETIEKMMGCFPFPEFPFEQEIDVNDYSLRNVDKIERILLHLTHGKNRLETKINTLEKKIEEYTKILDAVRGERYKNSRIIEIVDDDEEFEKDF